MDREQIRFNVLRNALYHTARRRILEAWNRRFNFLVILLGTAAATDILKQAGVDQVWVGVATAIVGALQLVFDFGGNARTHQSLQRDYYKLLSDIEAKTKADDAMCAGWVAQMTAIFADEPPVFRAMDAKAYNDALDGLGTYDADKDRLFIPWFHSFLSAIFYFDGYRYETLLERQRPNSAVGVRTE